MFNNKKLTIVFAALLILAAIILLLDSSKKESTFKQDLVSIDTANVSKIILYPKAQGHKEVKIFKENNEWKVQVAPNKFKSVPLSKVSNLLAQIVKIEPIRLAARDENKWKDYQVDSTGTRVEVFEGGEKTLDLIIGKFAFQQPRSMTSYVRLIDDKNTYAVDGFLEFTFNQDANSFRNETVINGNSNNWNKLTFTYPGDSSFQLTKNNGKWFIDEQQADSAKTAQYLSKISHLTNTEYLEAGNPGNSNIQLRIETDNKEIIEVSALKNDTQYLVRSSQNKDEVFDGSKNNFGSTLFKVKKDFTGK